MPRVSVVIPAHNAASFLGDALRSVEAQTFTDFEVVVVDDGSTDGTAQVVAAFPRARLVTRTNGGPSRARNDGVAATSGELIAFLDADDAWSPDKVQRQVALLDENPRAVLASCLMSSWTGEPIGRAEPLVGDATVAILRDHYVCPSTAIVRRAPFERVGGFTPDRWLSEDLELFLRLSLEGPVVSVAERLVRHRVRRESLSADTLALRRGTVAVLDELKQLPAMRPFSMELRRSCAEELYLIGRAELSAGDRLAARASFGRSRAESRHFGARSVLLQILSLLPSSLLRSVHSAREVWRGSRRRVAASE